MKTSVISTKEEQVPTTAETSPTSTTGNPPGQSSLPDEAPGGDKPPTHDMSEILDALYEGGFIETGCAIRAKCGAPKASAMRFWNVGARDPEFERRLAAKLPGCQITWDEAKFDLNSDPDLEHRFQAGKYDAVFLKIPDCWQIKYHAVLHHTLVSGFLKQSGFLAITCPFGHRTKMDEGQTLAETLKELGEADGFGFVLEREKFVNPTGWPRVAIDIGLDSGCKLEIVAHYQGCLPTEVEETTDTFLYKVVDRM